jgi:DNA phosphorothioation-associated putative methyltransferase
MDSALIRASIDELSYGKRLPTAVYVWDDGASFPPALRRVCDELRRRFAVGADYGLVKFHILQPKISFLSYPDFWTDPHPALAAAVIVDLSTGKVRRDSYADRANPPVLHRKETFLPPGHEKTALFAALTKDEEAAGLLEETARIGFKLNWQRLVAERGYRFRGHKLVPIKEASSRSDEPVITQPEGSGNSSDRQSSTRKGAARVERHRTAIARGEISKPVKAILEAAQLNPSETFFDYGCGLGADVRALVALGYSASGWDPAHASTGERQPSDVVNLGFVLNVIEDPAERVEVLVAAWGLTRRLLVVSTLIRGQENYSDFRCFGDGLLTSRNTFQKYFDPGEIQALIEDTLESEAVPVAMGIYFVFREVAQLQDFLSARTQRLIDWENLSSRLGLRRALRQKTDPYDTHRELLDGFWATAVGLGRVPREDEFDRLSEIRAACGSLPKAMALFMERFGQATFDAARSKRREDTLVYVAAARLRKRVPFSQLSPRLQRDIQSFFGSYAEAEKHALEILFAAGDVDELALSVQRLGFGWWDPAEQQFTVHRSLLDELPVILRVYVECGARLFGNPRESDLIKFHIRSRKLTFQIYDDFDGAAFPELRLRIKIDLPKLFVTVLEQRHAQERQILYFKERFVGPDYPNLATFRRIGVRLRKLGLDPATLGYGPSKSEFDALLRRAGLRADLTRRPASPSGAEIER